MRLIYYFLNPELDGAKSLFVFNLILFRCDIISENRISALSLAVLQNHETLLHDIGCAIYANVFGRSVMRSSVRTTSIQPFDQQVPLVIVICYRILFIVNRLRIFVGN